MKVNIHYEIDNSAPEAKKRFIRKMFTSIVPSYDALNRILSLGIDTLWRHSAIRSLGDIKGKLALDLCCGTGDLSKILDKKGARVVSLDFCHAMIEKGMEKNNLGGCSVVADASVLPFASDTFDVITIAFGIRNIPDLDNFIAETRRVLKPGGSLAILELTRPERRITGFFYGIYLTRFLPFIGWMISGRRVAYRYLSATISTFIDPDMLEKRFAECGFSETGHSHRTFGVATILKCYKGTAAPRGKDDMAMAEKLIPVPDPAN